MAITDIKNEFDVGSASVRWEPGPGELPAPIEAPPLFPGSRLVPAGKIWLSTRVPPDLAPDVTVRVVTVVWGRLAFSVWRRSGPMELLPVVEDDVRTVLQRFWRYLGAV